jgi:peptidoglycan hydrolase-like protein with peptidoglycan-binding domain
MNQRLNIQPEPFAAYEAPAGEFEGEGEFIRPGLPRPGFPRPGFVERPGFVRPGFAGRPGFPSSVRPGFVGRRGLAGLRADLLRRPGFADRRPGYTYAPRFYPGIQQGLWAGRPAGPASRYFGGPARSLGHYGGWSRQWPPEQTGPFIRHWHKLHKRGYFVPDARGGGQFVGAQQIPPPGSAAPASPPIVPPGVLVSQPGAPSIEPATPGPSATAGSGWVLGIQGCLAQSVGPWVPQNGLIGKATRKAIRDFQQAQSLPVTGLLDDVTVGALHSACGVQAAATPLPGTVPDAGQSFDPGATTPAFDPGGGALPPVDPSAGAAMGTPDAGGGQPASGADSPDAGAGEYEYFWPRS